MEPLEQKLTELTGVISTFRDKAQDELKTLGTTTKSTAEALISLQSQVDAIDTKMAQRNAQFTPTDTVFEALKSNEQLARLMKDRRGTASIHLTGKFASQLFEAKTTITSTAVGAATSGVLPIERIPGIVPEARQQLLVRDVLFNRPTTFQVIDFVRVNAPITPQSPTAEASIKPEVAVTFTTHSERVKTIATWIPATRQILDDLGELMGFLETALPYYVNLEEEIQLLSGDGTGENLNGLITQATAFSTSLLVASTGWNRIDIVGRTIQQITAAKELQPTFIVVHPNDWWSMRLQKDSFGRYILGDPQSTNQNLGAASGFAFTNRIQLFGLDVVPTTSIATGTFLVGSGSPIASEIRDRMEMQIDISTEHSDYFTRNMVAVRGEKRLALVVKRPASYVAGSFTNSPA